VKETITTTMTCPWNAADDGRSNAGLDLVLLDDDIDDEQQQ
jgi:hypothetical protein